MFWPSSKAVYCFDPLASLQEGCRSNVVKYIYRRLLQFIPVLFGISVVSFLIIYLAPGDPTNLLVNVEVLTDKELLEVRRSLGLEQPMPIQYVKMMGALLLRLT